MKGTLALVVVAAVAGWAFVFLPLGGSPERTPQAGATEVAQDATRPPGPPVPRAIRAPEGAARQAATAEDALHEEPSLARRSASSDAPSTAHGDVRVIGQTTDALAASRHARGPSDPTKPFNPDEAEATGELGEGILSPDFKLLEESYVREPRDGPWASQHESKIRAALYSSELRENVVIVHCQSSVCRIHLNPQGDDPFGDLVNVPGLATGYGLGSTTPYSLNGSELIVYVQPGTSDQTGP